MFDDKSPFTDEDASSLQHPKYFGMYRISPIDAGQRDAQIAMKEAFAMFEPKAAAPKPKL